MVWERNFSRHVLVGALSEALLCCHLEISVHKGMLLALIQVLVSCLGLLDKLLVISASIETLGSPIVLLSRKLDVGTLLSRPASYLLRIADALPRHGLSEEPLSLHIGGSLVHPAGL